MDEHRLWAPWRINYIVGEPSPTPALEPAAWLDGAERGCFVCRAAAGYADQGAADRRHLVVARGKRTLALLNLYPYSNGHVLVCPARHVAQLYEISPEEHLETMATLAELTQTLTTVLRAEGFNVGLNLGRVAGAGVPGHLHWHLVPRWVGDNNFMPVTADTRVISQSLESLWDALKNHTVN